MKYERIELRVDEEHKRKIAELRERYGTTASDALRRAIDEAHEKMMIQKRLDIVKRMSEANIEDVPDPDELKRQILAGHDKSDLP